MDICWFWKCFYAYANIKVSGYYFFLYICYVVVGNALILVLEQNLVDTNFTSLSNDFIKNALVPMLEGKLPRTQSCS